MLGFAVVAPLPFLAGQHTAHLAQHIDAGHLAKAQRLHKVMHGVHAQLVRQRIKIGITGLDNRAAHVHDAAALVLWAAKTMAAKHVKAGVIDQRCGLARAGL